jgi:thiamine-monophosphate kinase
MPLSTAAAAALAREPRLIETIVTGGDDYEVLATMPADRVEPFRRQAAEAGVAATDIGRIVAGHGQARLLDAQGRALALAHPSFSHF